MSINQRALIGKLNEFSRSAIEGALGLCVSRTHYNVELEHYLTKLLDFRTSGPHEYFGTMVSIPRNSGAS